MTKPYPTRRHRPRATSLIVTIDGKKVCTQCAENKPATTEFFHRNKNTYTGLASNCISCVSIIRKAFYWKQPELLKQKAKEAEQKVRATVIAAYGGKCACCGEAGHWFLTMDHVIGRAKGQVPAFAGSKLYRWLINHGFPKEFQLLCWNCNLAKHHYGSCPHKLAQKEVING